MIFEGTVNGPRSTISRVVILFIFLLIDFCRILIIFFFKFVLRLPYNYSTILSSDYILKRKSVTFLGNNIQVVVEKPLHGNFYFLFWNIPDPSWQHHQVNWAPAKFLLFSRNVPFKFWAASCLLFPRNFPGFFSVYKKWQWRVTTYHMC